MVKDNRELEEWTSVKKRKKKHLIQRGADSASDMNVGKVKDMNLEEQWGIPDIRVCNMPTHASFVSIPIMLSPVTAELDTELNS